MEDAISLENKWWKKEDAMVRLLQGWAGLFGVFVVLDVEGHAAFLSGLYRPHTQSQATGARRKPHCPTLLSLPHTLTISRQPKFSAIKIDAVDSLLPANNTQHCNPTPATPQSDRGRKLGYVWTHDRQDGSISTLKSFPFHARKTGAGHGRGGLSSRLSSENSSSRAPRQPPAASFPRYVDLRSTTSLPIP